MRKMELSAARTMTMEWLFILPFDDQIKTQKEKKRKTTKAKHTHTKQQQQKKQPIT